MDTVRTVNLWQHETALTYTYACNKTWHIPKTQQTHQTKGQGTFQSRKTARNTQQHVYKKKGDTYKEIEKKASERAGAQSITQHSSKHINATTTTNKPHIRGIRSAWAILVWKLWASGTHNSHDHPTYWAQRKHDRRMSASTNKRNNQDRRDRHEETMK